HVKIRRADYSVFIPHQLDGSNIIIQSLFSQSASITRKGSQVITIVIEWLQLNQFRGRCLGSTKIRKFKQYIRSSPQRGCVAPTHPRKGHIYFCRLPSVAGSLQSSRQVENSLSVATFAAELFKWAAN